jgi:hypothetical protein
MEAICTCDSCEGLCTHDKRRKEAKNLAHHTPTQQTQRSNFLPFSISASQPVYQSNYSENNQIRGVTQESLENQNYTPSTSSPSTSYSSISAHHQHHIHQHHIHQYQHHHNCHSSKDVPKNVSYVIRVFKKVKKIKFFQL